MDVHEATSTVREALIFSAVLRQPRDVSYEEKIAYVDFVIDLLELSDIGDAIIGSTYSVAASASPSLPLSEVSEAC